MTEAYGAGSDLLPPFSAMVVMLSSWITPVESWVSMEMAKVVEALRPSGRAWIVWCRWRLG